MSDKEVCHASQTRINTECAEFCSWLSCGMCGGDKNDDQESGGKRYSKN